MGKKLTKPEKFVKRFKEQNPNLNGYGCCLAIEIKLDCGYQDRHIPPEYRKAVKKYYGKD